MSNTKSRSKPTNSMSSAKRSGAKPQTRVRPSKSAKASSRASASAPDAKTRVPSKNTLMIEALRQSGGATIERLCAVSGWQSHSVRAALTGLKKKGYVITRSKTDGASVYTLTEMPQSTHNPAEPAK